MSPVAETSSGKLRGSTENGVVSFKGIPFARPPVGELRWRPPQPVEPWSGERAAQQFGRSALQRPLPGGIGDLIGIPGEPTDEDCLYLNVWTPGLDASRRPVMVWIHGGGNVVGSGSQPRINGEHLARRGDVVIVTLNYRLGAFGFLHAPELGASGNEALLDQVAALRWVRREIAHFGGDAGNVTVFGQSAGGFDIAQLLAMPAAAGCFDKAVPMSGSLMPQVPVKEAGEATARFAERFGGLPKLRGVPAEELLEFQLELTQGQLAGSVRFGPTLDGDFIRQDAAVPIGAGSQTAGMPLMIGNTRDESALFVVGTPELSDLDEAGLRKRAQRLFGELTDNAVEVYRNARAARGQSTAPIDILVAMLTDQTFRIPATRTAELHVSHTPRTWMYLFEYESPAQSGRLGSCHSLDIPFVWGTYSVENMKRFCGEGAVARELSERMMDTYLAFARTGNPSSESLPPWPKYDASERATMHLGEKCYVERAPMEEERQLWASLRPGPDR